MEMDWCTDFCLACDKQTSGKAYCSESCRLADISPESSPNLHSSSRVPSPLMLLPWAPYSHAALPSPQSPSYAPPAPAVPGFRLPPAFDFAAFRSPIVASATTTTTTIVNAVSQPFSIPSPLAMLKPSTSQTSLSSLRSQESVRSAVNDRAKSELRNYAGSFDHVRNWKRRLNRRGSISDCGSGSL
ncbi:MAG: hypothetical protein M1829_006466 [Trizodia sp. TS-e1964]|nr:MAG: hypothetical protein M1829_006466 [Trizodia sp. TS-e1964]